MYSLRYFGTLAGMALVTSFIGVATRSVHIDREFYAVAAQILPVFLLAVAIEGRLFVERPHDTATRRGIVGLLLVATLLSEICALIAVAHGSASDLVRGGVLTGLLLVIMLFGAIAGLDFRAPDETRPRQ